MIKSNDGGSGRKCLDSSKAAHTVLNKFYLIFLSIPSIDGNLVSLKLRKGVHIEFVVRITLVLKSAIEKPVPPF